MFILNVEDEINKAAKIIQKYWYKCYYDPLYQVCKKRILRQYLELTIA